MIREVLFLDMGIIVGYANHLKEYNKKFLIDNIDYFCEDSVRLIEKFKNKIFITCDYIINKDLPNFLERRKILREEIRKKLRNNEFKIGMSDKLYQRDVNWGEKVYRLKDFFKEGEREVFKLLLDLDISSELRIKEFKSTVIKEIVIPIREIDTELKSHYFTFTNNYSDSNIIASAIQYHTNNKNITMVTTDVKDMGWKLREWLGIDLKLNNKYKVPDVKYIRDIV